jgi:hypothetical protein
MIFIEEIELCLVGEKFHFINVFVVLNNVFVFEFVKRNQVRFLEPVTAVP